MQRTDQNAIDDKNAGGNLMSSNKGALRRLSLLAGSSLVAASLSTGAFTVALSTPTTALAYDECVPANGTTLTDGTDGVSDPTLNGATADHFVCAATTYPTGITYTSDGDLSVTSTNFAYPVLSVNLTGLGSDSVTWDSISGGIINQSSSTTPLLNVTTDTGDINISAAYVAAAFSSATNAIKAVSTGGGDITIQSGDAYAYTNPDAVAIEADSNGGDISITTTGATEGRLSGILAETSGTGGVTVNVTGDVLATGGAGTGVPVIESVVGVGETSINIAGGNIGAGTSVSNIDTGAVAIGASSQSSSATAVNVQNTGGVIFGSVDFSDVASGGVTFTNSGTGRWLAGGTSLFGGGDDTLTFASDLQTVTSGIAQNKVLAGASINFGAGNDVMDVQTALDIGDLSSVGAQLDFGTGADTVKNSGSLSIDGPVTFANLEAFNNSGVLYLGAKGAFDDTVIDFSNGDTDANDVLRMPGTAFTGSGTSRLVAAVHFDTSKQAGCATPTGGADCLYLPGGATAGSTLVTLINAGPDATQGAFNPTGVTVIDVNGGTSHAGDFTLDPNSAGYVIDPRYGPAISRPGLFVYSLRYDAATQRHVVVGLPRSETMEYAMLGSAAQSVWHMTTDTVNNRQTDLRAGSEGDVWVRASGEYSKRDVSTQITSLADTFTFDDSYKQYAGTIMGGMDFAHGGGEGYSWVLGGEIGYVSSSFDLDASPSSGRLTGGTGGVYGSYWSDRLFVDGTLNSNFLTLDYDAPGLGSKTNTWVRSVGGQLDSGMRFMLTDTVFAEPLATFAFAHTTFEELSLAGGEVKPADADSRRAALGLRVGADLLGGPLNVRYYVAGRAWREFEGKYKGIVANPGQDVPLADDASGNFGEANAGISIFNDDRTATGFLDAGAKFGDGYSAVDLNLGVRLRW